MHYIIIIMSIRASAELIAAMYASGQVLMTIIQKIFVNRYILQWHSKTIHLLKYMSF